MKRRRFLTMLIIFLIVPLYLVAEKKSDLPEKYKKWIEEEVIYIITQTEKEVFYKLETDKDRDLFVEEFWRQRDPTPGTPRNEFKEEHYRRIEYANNKLRKYTPIEGWRTDQGRIYITLGKPADIEKWHRPETHPIEIWTYFGNPKFGQAPIFRLLFVRKYGVGPYELYSPIIDGPKSLTPLSDMYVPDPRALVRRGIPSEWIAMVQDPRDLVAWDILMDRVSFDLASAAWSAFPGRGGPVHMIPTSILVEEVRNYPQKKIKDDYAYEFLEHKAVVEVDYSVNHIGGLYSIQILEDKPGLFFINYSLEPDTLSVDFYEDKYFTNIRMSIRVTDSKEKTILQYTRNFPIELKKKQLKQIKDRPFQIHDSFPLIPGNYKLNLLFENMVTKEFTTVERDIFVPDPGSLQMSSIILADRVIRDSPNVQLNKAFQIGSLQIYPSMKNHFNKEGNLYVFFQIYGLTDELKEQGSLVFSFYKGEKKFKTITKKVCEYGNNRDFLEEIPLEGIPSGLYGVEVSLLDREGNEILFDRKEFSVSGMILPTSWIVSQSNPPSDDPVYFYFLGNQFINNGEIGKARDLLEKACFMKPDSLDFALSYAKAIMLQRKYNRVKEILEPFAKEKRENFSLYYYLGKSAQEVSEFEEAISFYQEALSHKGNVVEILNSIGDCYFNLDDKEEALKAWKKSLEINPSQDKIKKRVNDIRKK